jgi:hypothetical protein
MWQTLERKARFISQVMHARLNARDISDIGDTALSFSEVKALATGNPLLIDKAEADAELTRLERAERAHHRAQQMLGHTITRHEQDIAVLTRQSSEVDAAVGRRQDTRGDKFTMTIDGQRHTRRADAGQQLARALQREAAEFGGWGNRALQVGHLGGFPVIAALQGSREGKTTSVSIALDGAPGTSIELKPSDLRDGERATLITRLEHRLARLEDRKAGILADIEHAEREIAHARENLGQPFPQAEQLFVARDRVQQINGQLEQMAARQQADAEPAPEGPTPSSPSAEAGTRERADHMEAHVPDPQSGTESEPGRHGQGTVGAYERDHERWRQPGDWRDQLMVSSRQQWMPKVPAPPDAAALRPPETDIPETSGLESASAQGSSTAGLRGRSGYRLLKPFSGLTV